MSTSLLYFVHSWKTEPLIYLPIGQLVIKCSSIFYPAGYNTHPPLHLITEIIHWLVITSSWSVNQKAGTQYSDACTRWGRKPGFDLDLLSLSITKWFVQDRLVWPFPKWLIYLTCINQTKWSTQSDPLILSCFFCSTSLQLTAHSFFLKGAGTPLVYRSHDIHL